MSKGLVSEDNLLRLGVVASDDKLSYSQTINLNNLKSSENLDYDVKYQNI